MTHHQLTEKTLNNFPKAETRSYLNRVPGGIERLIADEEVQILHSLRNAAGALVTDFSRFLYGNRRRNDKLGLLVRCEAELCVAGNQKPDMRESTHVSNVDKKITGGDKNESSAAVLKSTGHRSTPLPPLLRCGSRFYFVATYPVPTSITQAGSLPDILHQFPVEIRNALYYHSTRARNYAMNYFCGQILRIFLPKIDKIFATTPRRGPRFVTPMQFSL